MHPFIKKYLDAQAFDSKYWAEYLSKDNLLEITILRLSETLNKYPYPEKLNEDEIDQALMYGHEDANLFLFFISTAILCLTQHQQLEKAKSLVSIGEDSINSNVSPVLHCLFLQTYSRLKFFLGELKEEKRLMEESLKLISRDSPRYGILFVNYSYLLARSGMLNDLSVAEKKILTDDIDTRVDKGSLVYEIQLANCIMQGDYENGYNYLKAFHKAIDYKSTSRYKNASISLYILSGKRLPIDYLESEFDDVKGVFEDFQYGRWHMMPENIKVLKKIEGQHPFVYFITKYLFLHFELSNKNAGRAKLILQENQKLGKGHFLDDLFYARIALLEKKRNEALFFFKRLMLNVQKYGFLPRLEFELQFAKEIAAADLFFLFQKASEFTEKNIALEENIEMPVEDNPTGLDLIVGESSAISKVKKLIQKFANIAEPVLITGETGTGKELVAKAIHDIGVNAAEPFLAINCGSLTDALLQSELFGYEAGAFTGAQKEKRGIFEAAGKGTVFLDEFEDVSPKMQSSLLRVLESNEIRLIGGVKSRSINCKIVIASNVALKSLVSKKIFREDLYFRLARFEIKLPALRARKDDIPALIRHFLSYKKQEEISSMLSEELSKKLIEYEWPGNIRELRNSIERMKVLHADKKVFGVDEFDFDQLEEFNESKNANLKTQNIEKSKEPVLERNENINEEERIKKIIANGFKIETRLEIIKDLFLKYKKLSRSQVKDILRINPITAAKALNTLSEEGFIEKKMPTKSTKSHYFQLKEK